MTDLTTPADVRAAEGMDPEAAAARPVPPKAKKKKRKGGGGAKPNAGHQARRAAAKGLPSSFDVHYGEDPKTGDPYRYVVTRAAAEDVELFEKIEDGNYITAVRGFLGVVQWTTFKERHRNPDDGRVPMDALEGLLQAIVDQTRGAGAEGNS